MGELVHATWQILLAGDCWALSELGRVSQSLPGAKSNGSRILGPGVFAGCLTTDSGHHLPMTSMATGMVLGGIHMALLQAWKWRLAWTRWLPAEATIFAWITNSSV